MESYTEQILSKIKLEDGYEITDFTLRVDGTAYLYAKHKNKYFEKIFTAKEMKLPVEYWIKTLPKIIYNNFYGWAVKKGYRKL